MAWGTFWKVYGLCRYRCGDKIVARSWKQRDTISFMHVECVVNLAPPTLHGFNMLVVLTLSGKLGVLFIQLLLLCLELEPGGLELVSGLIYDGSQLTVVDRFHVLVGHEDL